MLPAEAAPRIKDIADFEGVRENQLVGYGLVVGLAGTGDSLRNSPFTRQKSWPRCWSASAFPPANGNLNTRNVAAVMVTANLPAFASQGTRIDVTVSALGDSRSLAGGQLLATPLMGADQQVYAVAQGPLAIGGFSAEGASGSSGLARRAHGGPHRVGRLGGARTLLRHRRAIELAPGAAQS